jgi:hypothetical protein
VASCVLRVYPSWWRALRTKEHARRPEPRPPRDRLAHESGSERSSALFRVPRVDLFAERLSMITWIVEPWMPRSRPCLLYRQQESPAQSCRLLDRTLAEW